ncbi:MAG: DDE-type integrase/transposase/recombinase [Nitrososphaerales archaeon]
MKAFEWLLKAVQDRHVFERNKLPLERKVLACLLYMAGLSYRAMTFRTGLIESSHVAVHYWFHKLRGLLQDGPPKRRRCIAVDETKLKEDGCQLFVWAAIDVDTKELLAVYVSYQRSSLNTYLFMRRVLARCVGKPTVLVDGGP